MEKYFEGNVAKVIDFENENLYSSRQARKENLTRNFNRVSNTRPSQKTLQIASFVHCYTVDDLKRDHERKEKLAIAQRREAIIEAIMSVVKFVLVTAFIAAELIGFTYLFYKAGLAEHPATSTMARIDRSVTAAFQTGILVLPFDYILYSIYNFIKEARAEYLEG